MRLVFPLGRRAEVRRRSPARPASFPLTTRAPPTVPAPPPAAPKGPGARRPPPLGTREAAGTTSLRLAVAEEEGAAPTLALLALTPRLCRRASVRTTRRGGT